MKWWYYIYLPQGVAAQLGFTHHGTIYGVPGYLAQIDEETNMACPKFVPLQCYAIVMDNIFEFLSHFLPEDVVVNTPMTFGRAFDAVE